MSAVDIAPPSRPVGFGREFLAGVRFLLRGLKMYTRSPRLMLLGLIPAFITLVLLVAALVTLGYFVDDLAALATWFADDWSTGWRQAIRIAAGVAIMGGAVLLSFVGYTALTLVIGEPFYEAISKNVEDRLGGLPGEVDIPFWRSLPRSIADSLHLLALTALFGIPLFFAGFIPLVGGTVVPVIGALVGGWFLSHELIGVPFERRGLRMRDRRRMLKQRRALATGFGAATFVCFLIPFGAVLIMPAAVAGATLMTRHLFGMSDRLNGQ
ncbi:EI24 domain-containing protein [Luedemannella helvata]|uniref:EI24 domain-containing protein n=1 Tax=Luedemannella helvata TaxID=349315 RepID=A0ABN2L296_9ACTN